MSSPILWKILPCTLADTSPLGRNNTAAFFQESMWRTIWPADKTLPFLTEQLTHRVPLRLLMDRHKMRHQKAVHPDTGELVGYARWELPMSRYDGQGEGEGEEGKVEWPGARVDGVSEEEEGRYREMAEGAWWGPREGDLLGELDGVNEGIRERVVAGLGGEVLVLDYLAVHPDNKGKGVATALVESGIREAEGMGLPIFVFAWKSARELYLRLGFKEVERSIQDASSEKYGFGPKEYNVYFMVYEPELLGVKEMS